MYRRMLARDTGFKMLWPQASWKGTEAESRALLDIIARNCACSYAPNGALVRACSPHYELVRSQRFLDGMLYGRRMAAVFLREEWSVAPSPAAAPRLLARRRLAA
jgi:hypothetical protein